MAQRRVAAVEIATAPADYAARPAFEDFFAAAHGRVVGLVFVLCGGRAQAEELAQEAFVRAYQRWSTVSGYDDPGAWVRRVAANLDQEFERLFSEAVLHGAARLGAVDVITGVDGTNRPAAWLSVDGGSGYIPVSSGTRWCTQKGTAGHAG